MVMKLLLISTLIFSTLINLTFRNSSIDKFEYIEDTTLHFKYNTTELETKSQVKLNKLLSVIDTTPSFFKKYELNIKSKVCIAEHKKDSMLFFKRSKVINNILIKRFKEHSKRIKLIPSPIIIEKEEYCKNNTGVLIIIYANYLLE